MHRLYNFVPNEYIPYSWLSVPPTGQPVPHEVSFVQGARPPATSSTRCRSTTEAPGLPLALQPLFGIRRTFPASADYAPPRRPSRRKRAGPARAPTPTSFGSITYPSKVKAVIRADEPRTTKALYGAMGRGIGAVTHSGAVSLYGLAPALIMASTGQRLKGLDNRTGARLGARARRPACVGPGAEPRVASVDTGRRRRMPKKTPPNAEKPAAAAAPSASRRPLASPGRVRL